MADLKKFSKDGKIGYKSPNGEIVIHPLFDDGVPQFGRDSSYHTEFARVFLAGKCGIINEMGDTVIPIDYEELIPISEGVFIARKNLPERKWCIGVIKYDGTVLIPFEYQYITKMGPAFNCFKEAVSVKKQYEPSYEYRWEKDPVVRNSQGITIFEGQIFHYKNDLLVVEKDNRYGIINTEGQLILDVKYDEILIANPERYIVRINEGETWSVGVLDAFSKIIIDFNYKCITTTNGAFYDCFKKSDSTLKDSYYRGERYDYRNKAQEYWFNASGKEVYQGKADILSEDLLACDKEGKKAVINFSGKRIVNFLYDRIHLLDNYLIVEKDGKVGLITADSGSVILDASYDCIEFVHIDDSVSPNYTVHLRVDGNLYGSFNKENIFDTAAGKDRLNRQQIRFVNKTDYPRYVGLKYPGAHYSFNDVMILRSATFAELFSLEEGILQNSRFDTVQQLTDINYVVSSKGKYGVYRRDIHNLFIPCKYDRVVFEGGHVVLLCDNGLWGATSLDPETNPFYPISETDMPVKYKEISILNDKQTLFGVKQVRVDYYGKEFEEYTIVDEMGEQYEKIDRVSRLESMPVYYGPNHILSSRNGKFGFVSAQGYVGIPFIYDECSLRPDSLFNVRIDNRWGVIALSGKEVVSIRYKTPVPDSINDAVVIDACSERSGVLAADGKEKVPTIYDHIMIDESLIYCGYGGSEYVSSRCPDNNFFCGEISGATWGVYSKDGKSIIEPIYDCFKEQDGFILAGRDGGFLSRGQLGFSYREEEYGGVYDLYDYCGNLILGGFNKFIKEEKHNLFLFHFGGHWEQECGEYDYYDYSFIEGNGRWLITDDNLTSIIPRQNGSSFRFQKGAKCTITKKKENGKTINYWSFSLDLFSVKQPRFENGFMIFGDDSTQRAIRLRDQACSLPYTKIKSIDDNLFFTYIHKEDSEGIGISSIENELIGCNEHYLLLTKPVFGYVFAVQKIDEENYSVVLLNTRVSDYSKTAIKKIEYWTLSDLIKDGKLQLLGGDGETSTQCVIVRNKSIFDASFIASVRVEERDTPYNNKAPYWFSVDFISFSDSDADDGSYYDDGVYEDPEDYERETWDAMTDGMYGDMPDGFDGDYSFLGR